jgi:hypothetical protein
VPLLNPVAKALRVAQMRLLEGGFDDKVQYRDALATLPAWPLSNHLGPYLPLTVWYHQVEVFKKRKKEQKKKRLRAERAERRPGV